MDYSKRIMITGGAGFIGSHAVKHFVKKYQDCQIINADALTYAGNLENLLSIENEENYVFEKLDIRDLTGIRTVFDKYKISHVIHFAAESHVDRSITDPLAFVETNVMGTCNLLTVAKEKWGSGEGLFYHVSTDEVYGSLGDEGLFREDTAYDPRSPYSASKAASDHFVRAYFHTYNLPVVLSNCSNNYGPYHFPEKLIPLMINNIFQKKKLPVYGDGLNVRDWLYVEDHVKAIDTVFSNGTIGETYNIGGHNELSNIDLVHKLCDIMDELSGNTPLSSRELITFVEDRKGHDKRYAIDATKIKNELNWMPLETVDSGLRKTVKWYMENKDWLKNVTSGDYKAYYDEQYGK